MGIKQFFFFLFISVSITFTNSNWSHAAPAKYDALVQMVTRPTMDDFEKAMTPWPRANPFNRPSPRTGLVKTELPKVIASLEMGFSGGTYAFLGRDSVFLADIVDMFYRSIGQTNRVVRLNASGQSIVDNLIVDFLATNGLSVQTVDHNPPFVIIDRTSFGPGSQSTRYLKAFYDRYEKSGGVKRNLIRKVNVISTTPNTIQLNSMNTVAQGFLRGEKLGFPDVAFSLTDAYHFSDGALWHGNFGLFTKRPDGTVYSPVSANGANDPAGHWAILSELYDAMMVINTPEFRESVKNEAKKLGYEFPLEPKQKGTVKFPSFEEMAEENFREARKALSTSVGELKTTFEEKGEPFSENGMVIFNWVKANVYGATGPKSSSFALLALTSSISAFENKKITDRDFRRLIKRVLANYPIQESEGQIFKDGLVKIFNANATFRTVWTDKAEYFKDPSHKSGPEGSKVYSEISEYFAKKCDTILGL